MKNLGDNVFRNVPVGPDEAALVESYLNSHDFAASTRRAVIVVVYGFMCGDPGRIILSLSRCRVEQDAVTGTVE